MFKKKKIRRSLDFKKNNQLTDIEKAREARKEKRGELVQNAQTKNSEKEESSRRKIIKRNRKRNFFAAVMVAIVALICVSVYNIISVHSQLDEALAANELLEREKASREYELQNVDSPEYVEQQARTKLKMIRPGEIFYVVPPDNDEE